MDALAKEELVDLQKLEEEIAKEVVAHESSTLSLYAQMDVVKKRIEELKQLRKGTVVHTLKFEVRDPLQRLIVSEGVLTLFDNGHVEFTTKKERFVYHYHGNEETWILVKRELMGGTPNSFINFNY